MQTNTDKLIASKENGIGWITFNNPARHNAVSLEMWQALTSTLEAYATDPDVRVIILKGAGEKAFVAGADISQFKEKRSSPEAVQHYNTIADEASETLRSSPKPTVAMISKIPRPMPITLTAVRAGRCSMFEKTRLFTK